LFIFLDSFFKFCNSVGYGGAVACFSNSFVDRCFFNCNFSGNEALNSGVGNDYADLSADVDTIRLYGYHSVINVVSTSEEVRFYHQRMGTSLDCLLNDSCRSSTIFVSSGFGIDGIGCGLIETLPCKNVEYAWDEHLMSYGTIVIVDGTHTMKSRDVSSSFNVTIQGDPTSGAGQEDMPTIYPDTGNQRICWMNISSAEIQILFFIKLNIVYLHGICYGSLFRTESKLNTIYIQSCVFSSDNVSISSELITGSFGNIFVMDSIFQNFLLEVELVHYDVSNSSSECHFINCSFISITSTSSFPLLINAVDDATLNMTSCYVFNVTNLDVSTFGGVIQTTGSSKHFFYNNTFTYVNSSRSCMVVNGSSDFTFVQFVFDTVTTGNSSGGAVSIVSEEMEDQCRYTFLNCSFAHCETYYGFMGGFFFCFIIICIVLNKPFFCILILLLGAVYSAQPSIVLLDCTFRQNIAGNKKGNDIFILTNNCLFVH
jgi:hypothetical protein